MESIPARSISREIRQIFLNPIDLHTITAAPQRGATPSTAALQRPYMRVSFEELRSLGIVIGLFLMGELEL